MRNKKEKAMTSFHRPKKDLMMQFRVNSQDKFTIQRAAKLKGLEPSVYMRSLIMDSARKEVQTADEARLVLSPEEWEQFINVMNAPVTLNKTLKKAFSDFKKKYG